MSEYYAIVSSSDSFAHYGVKGMKWGIRKAKSAATTADRNTKLAKQYKKALKKAKKLNTKANVQRSKNEYKQRMADAAAEIGGGATLAGSGLALDALYKKTGTYGVGVGHIGLIPYAFDTRALSKVAVPLGAMAGAAGAYNLAKGVAAKRRTTAKGHAKAVAKAKNWQSEMKEAFKGTKYAGLPGAKGMTKSRPYESAGTQLKNAGKAGAVGAVAGPGAASMYTASRSVANDGRRTSSKKKRKR